MSTNNNPGQLSPDGHWVWNGTEWTPVQPNVMATASDAPMAQPAKKGLGRGAKIGIGVGAALLALFAIGSLSGGGSDDTTATPATSAADPTPQDTPTPAVEDTPTPEPEAIDYTPANSDWAVKLKITDKQCFGSAGCNLELKPKITYVGDATLPDTGSVEITFTVSGDESGSVIETRTIDLADGTYDGSTIFVSTTGSDVTPKAKVTDVEYSDF